MTKSLYKLAELINADISSQSDSEIVSICNDSREVEAGALFFCQPVNAVDGSRYIEQAFRSGAIAAVVEQQAILGDRPGLIVESTRKAWSKVCSDWFGNPSSDMLVAGVTGTNGKTSVQYLLSQALTSLGHTTVQTGTLGVFINGEFICDSLTTPDAFNLHKNLAEAKVKGVDSAVMEVSSHGLSQSRVDDVDFDIAIFTNLTRDHLDYHGSFEDYYLAKQRLFYLTAKSGNLGAVLNLDDENSERLIAYCTSLSLPVVTYGFSCKADICIKSIDLDISGSALSYEVGGISQKFQSACIGEHNALNLAAVWGALKLASYTDNQIVEVLSKLRQASGRLESVGTSELGVYVDYAHTPDALANALRALRPVSNGKLWVVFGCGGDRDAGKRPIMGRIASEYADEIVVTSDNPRTEDPNKIIDDILKSGIKPYLAESDRAKAIVATIDAAAPGDVVLIAGKGHEDYQIWGKEKIFFSDQKVVRDYFLSKDAQ